MKGITVLSLAHLSLQMSQTRLLGLGLQEVTGSRVNWRHILATHTFSGVPTPHTGSGSCSIREVPRSCQDSVSVTKTDATWGTCHPPGTLVLFIKFSSKARCLACCLYSYTHTGHTNSTGVPKLGSPQSVSGEIF